MKKIFVLTGEPSGDKLASKVIGQLISSRSDIEYLSVGGEHLKALGIKSLYDLKEVTYLGFTKVLLNVFKIKSKINETVKEIIKFKPDILFSIDSPDFTLRVSKKVKKLRPGIKTIHFVSPKVYVWRKGRIKKFKYFLDHILLLFPFEKKYYDEENFLDLIIQLQEKKILIYLTSDERSKDKFKKIFDKYPIIKNDEFSNKNLPDKITIFENLNFDKWVELIYSSKYVITPECGCVHISSLCKNQLTVIYDPDNLPKAIMHEYAPWKVSYNKLIFDDRKLNQKIMSFIQ